MLLLVASFIPASLASAGEGAALARVRQATVAYHDVTAAEADGYGAFLDCFDSPGVGGMGQHYAKFLLVDGVIEADEPEVLVYEIREEELKLVAVEYVLPQTEWSSTDPPTLFGVDFTRNDTLGIWALHAWIWQANPKGTFANYNPNISMCS